MSISHRYSLCLWHRNFLHCLVPQKKKCANQLCSSCSNGTKITTVDRNIRCRLPVGWIFKVCGPNRASIHYHGIRLIFTKRCLIGQAEVVIYNFIHLMFIGKENAWVCRPVDRKLTLCKKTPTRNINSTSFLINVQNIITGIKQQYIYYYTGLFWVT